MANQLCFIGFKNFHSSHFSNPQFIFKIRPRSHSFSHLHRILSEIMTYQAEEPLKHWHSIMMNQQSLKKEKLITPSIIFSSFSVSRFEILKNFYLSENFRLREIDLKKYLKWDLLELKNKQNFIINSFFSWIRKFFILIKFTWISNCFQSFKLKLSHR